MEETPIFFNMSIISDKIWVLEYDPEIKLQIMKWHTLSFRKRRKKESILNIYHSDILIATALLKKFVPQGQRVNQLLSPRCSCNTVQKGQACKTKHIKQFMLCYSSHSSFNKPLFGKNGSLGFNVLLTAWSLETELTLGVLGKDGEGNRPYPFERNHPGICLNLDGQLYLYLHLQSCIWTTIPPECESSVLPLGHLAQVLVRKTITVAPQPPYSPDFSFLDIFSF